MRIKALKSFATKGMAPTSGQVVDCSEGLALDLIAAGYAEKAEEDPEPVATSQQEEASAESEEKNTEDNKDDNKSGNKKRAVSTAKGKRRSTK